MAILDKSNIEEVNKYKKFIDNYKLASFMQSYEWHMVKPEWDCEYIYIESGGKIVMAISLLIRKIIFGFSLIYAPRGPVGDVTDVNIVNKLMKDIDQIAKKYNSFVFRFDPEYLYDENLEKKYQKLGFKVKNRKCNKKELTQPRLNMIMNISGKTEEEIFKGYSEKTRYNIRLAKRKGIVVRYSRENSDIEKFHKLYNITSLRNKIAGRPVTYFQNMLKAFDEKHMRVYVAEYDKKELSAAITINFNGKMFYLYGASSNEKRNLMPNYLMQQEMIKWAIEEKCDLYDFGGVFELKKENGLYKFKEGFCRQEGVTEFIGEIEKTYKPFIYWMFTKAVPFYKKTRKKIKENKNRA